jgi:predicted PurR-regulated permease PerM
MNQREWQKDKLVRWLGLLAVTLIALYLCWLMLQPFIEVLLWALVLVIVFYPVHRRIDARIGKPGWSAALSCLLVIVTILVPLTLITLAVVSEMTKLAQNLQGNVQGLLDPNSPFMKNTLGWVGQYVDVSGFNPAKSQEWVAERLRNLSGAIAGRTLGFVGGVVGTIVEVFFVIFTMYYLFRDGKSLRAAARQAMPLDNRKSGEILLRTRDVISASVYGVLVIATIQGVLGGIGFWIAGLPSALLWGVVMIFLSMIPMAGAFIVWVPAAIYLFATGEWGWGIFLTVWGVLIIGSIDNFLRPKLVGERTRLHELLIFFSVLGGLQVFGVIGLVLGPVIVAIAIALLDVLRHADNSPGEATDEQSLFEEQSELRRVPEGSA